MGEEGEHMGVIPGVCAGIDNPHDGERQPIDYDEIVLVRFYRHSETRYRVVIETGDGRQSVIADGMGHWLAGHLTDGLVANGTPVWFWDEATTP